MFGIRKIVAGLATGLFLSSATFAHADCGEVSITEMNWASSQFVTAVATYLMENGYGCTVKKVPSSTVTSVVSLAENSEPDIVTELWLNSAGPAYLKLEAEGKVIRLANVITPGGVEGWWIPQYLADAHPELLTIEGIMANPELVGGRFHNFPEGWGGTIVNKNLITALDMESEKMKIFGHGSVETMAASIASAYNNKEPWFGAWYGPTLEFGRYPMARVKIGPYDEDIHLANQSADNPNPQVSDYPDAPVITVSTAAFTEREPEVAELMRNVTFDVNYVSSMLSWMNENGATADEAAAHFLDTQSSIWSQWLNDSAREKLAALIK